MCELYILLQLYCFCCCQNVQYTGGFHFDLDTYQFLLKRSESSYFRPIKMQDFRKKIEFVEKFVCGKSITLRCPEHDFAGS